MNSPRQCRNLDDIRAEIDRRDRQIIALLGERFAYVKAAAKFKTDATAVKAPERFAAMLQQRRDWATDEGLSPDAIEKMYRDLVNHFIAEELKQWQNKTDPKPPLQ
ncbi:MAG: isochorismate lyase [Cyanobacteria bacterium P01_A01_bin.3]